MVSGFTHVQFKALRQIKHAKNLVQSTYRSTSCSGSTYMHVHIHNRIHMHIQHTQSKINAHAHAHAHVHTHTHTLTLANGTQTLQGMHMSSEAHTFITH